MPVFTSQLRSLDYGNARESLQAMANHIRYIQEQLEYTLMNLDSTNITEIETDVTTVTSTSGGVRLTGNSITLSGSGGEYFEAGTPEGENSFRFTLKGKGGAQILYMTGGGELVITNNATVHIDGGTW